MENIVIEKLEARGFNRWTKGNLDRLYINTAQLGLVCSYYKTGNISYAEINGREISHCEARRMKAAKTFIDVKTGKVFSDHDDLKEIAEEILAEVEAEVEAEAKEDVVDSEDTAEETETILDVESSAAALFEGGWTAEDREQIASEYGLSLRDADRLCEALARYGS